MNIHTKEYCSAMNRLLYPMWDISLTEIMLNERYPKQKCVFYRSNLYKVKKQRPLIFGVKS